MSDEQFIEVTIENVYYHHFPYPANKKMLSVINDHLVNVQHDKIIEYMKMNLGSLTFIKILRNYFNGVSVIKSEVVNSEFFIEYMENNANIYNSPLKDKIFTSYQGIATHIRLQIRFWIDKDVNYLKLKNYRNYEEITKDDAIWLSALTSSVYHVYGKYPVDALF